MEKQVIVAIWRKSTNSTLQVECPLKAGEETDVVGWVVAEYPGWSILFAAVEMRLTPN
jgi:hypothetical protein